jgi:hypothetical protein
MRRPNQRKLQRQCDEWNARNPIGTEVRYYPVADEVGYHKTRTRSEATILSGHTAVVWLDNIAGCVSLDHCGLESESVQSFEAASEELPIRRRANAETGGSVNHSPEEPQQQNESKS